MKYPPFLKQNGTIGFVAPSFGCNGSPYREAFDNAQKKLSERGFRLSLGPNCYAGQGIGISNTPQKCAAELMEAWQKQDIDCLISCGGGELMCEILEYLDFDRLAETPPKWYMGYSDNTNFTFLLATLCDTASVYGPNAAAFGMEPWHPSLEDALSLLIGKSLCVSGYPLWEKESLKDETHPLAPYHTTQPRVLKKFPDRDLEFSGRLLGGCMDCLVNLTGTRFDRVGDFVKKYKDDGILWFLEACDLNVFGIRRAMWQMEQAGWFAHTKGFLIGRPLCFGQESMGLNAYEAILSTASRHRVPVLMDVDLGHLPPMMPLITGSMAHVRSRGNDICIQMQLR